MVIHDREYGDFDVLLEDDGTLDTVISVCPENQFIFDQIGKKEIRFSTEYGTEFRDDTGAMTDDGFDELAAEAIESYIGQYLLT